MKRVLKWLGWGLCGLLGLVLATAAAAWLHSERALNQTYAIDDPPLTRSTDPAVLARGEHLYQTRGCGACHGGEGEGSVVMDAGPVLRAVAPNLTPARLDPAYDVDALAAAVRHGVRADQRGLIFMPAATWSELGDEDMAALASYILALPPHANDPRQTEVRPLGRLLNMVGAFPLLSAATLDHQPRQRETPAPSPTPAYGAYLAAFCADCHGSDMRGGKQFGPDMPVAANLTMHPDGLGNWSEADFNRALRQGQRPDGSQLHPIMPWRATARMSDLELEALWRYLGSLPPLADAK